MGNLRVKRVSYIRRNGVLIPHKKTIFEKLEDDCYRVIEYNWIKDKKGGSLQVHQVTMTVRHCMKQVMYILLIKTLIDYLS